MFTNRDLRNMIVPLFFEQLLVMLVGVADGLIVSYAGEAAVSGVSLVNSFNTIFIYLFTALASGGAVVISQYLGRGSRESACESAGQLLASSCVLAVVIAAVVLTFHRGILSAMFGDVEPAVMNACIVYLAVTACSFPRLPCITPARRSAEASARPTLPCIYRVFPMLSICSATSLAYLCCAPGSRAWLSLR